MSERNHYFNPKKYKYVVERLECLSSKTTKDVYRYKITDISRFRKEELYLVGKTLFLPAVESKDFRLLDILNKKNIINFSFKAFLEEELESVELIGFENIKSTVIDDLGEAQVILEEPYAYLSRILFMEDFYDLEEVELKVFPCNSFGIASQEFSELSFDQKRYCVDRFIEDLTKLKEINLFSKFIDCWMIVVGNNGIRVLLSDVDRIEEFPNDNEEADIIYSNHKNFFRKTEEEISEYYSNQVKDLLF